MVCPSLEQACLLKYMQGDQLHFLGSPESKVGSFSNRGVKKQ